MFIIIAFIIALSILFSQFVFYFNLYLLYSILYSKRIGFKPELLIIYCRIAADICYSFCVSCMKTNFLVSQFSKKLIVKNLSFFLLEGSITMGIIRATIAFLITLKRFIATFFPTFFHNNWRKIPLYWIIIPILCHLLFDQCIIFGFCGNVIDVPVDCDNFQCTFNECYQKYWEFHEQVVFSLIETLSLLLFIRLYIWKRSSHLLHKVTQIALLDSLMLLLFNISPLLLYSYFSSTLVRVNYPLITVSRNAGSAIESVILWKLLSSKKKVSPNNIRLSNL
ncbi:Serpentine Receptor, class BC (Class B-like) [Caenorhabditis elegans]|uniref:Serpentine Receptor, class BC (Class B-like) n=1 Tax=Caenorhabditis elegans TaxID=6239 RepID=O45567_CAEEL|nr:Serpentine Receptor, class BC (Class B-like) [Caenorhabditis elegans]CAB07631.2 Serpentine Receptor, class BC (Class B-like) [Caenorhabditis elegans]|eukprot:NP_506956.2 Serpentine Receptor, class BC (class B-like) [Caenorhabditis elegans]